MRPPRRPGKPPAAHGFVRPLHPARARAPPPGRPLPHGPCRVGPPRHWIAGPAGATWGGRPPGAGRANRRERG